MSADLVWKNLIAYCLQVGLLVGLAAFVPGLLRLRVPRVKLAYWQILLLACLLLPLAQRWQPQVIASSIEISSVLTALAPAGAPAPRRIPASAIGLGLLAAGAVARLGWLTAGFWRLWLHRRRSHVLRVGPPWRTRAEIRLSRDVASPVTFGVRRPVVLVPAQFPAMEERTQRVILCHELRHVERRDWLFTVAEELVRAVFWFHPAIWWLLGEIQLAREQAVDREVIDLTHEREEYVDALLAIAGAKPQLDLAPAPLFLRRRHLKQRVVSIFHDGRISRTRAVSALAAGLGILAAVSWFVTVTFPLSAAPQIVNDAAGISVDLGGAELLHRPGVEYPAAARATGIQGSVAVEVTLDGSGSVSDARALNGPEELRKAALASVLQWHFAHEASGSRRVVTLTFRLPEGFAAAAQTFEDLRRTNAEFRRMDEEFQRAAKALRRVADAREHARPSLLQTVKSIVVTGLPDGARSELLSQLSVEEGQQIGPGVLEKIASTVKAFDQHLTVSTQQVGPGEMAIVINAPQPQRIRVGGTIQQARLIRQPKPIYPTEAKAARIQGVVKLSVVIGKDGTVRQIELLSGHPLLTQSAIDAVREWEYEPTFLNGEPVEVLSQVDVNYTLSW